MSYAVPSFLPERSLPWIAGATALVGASILLMRALSNTSSLPPGPPGYPIIGNLFDVPTGDRPKAYQQMSRDFGTHASLESAGILVT